MAFPDIDILGIYQKFSFSLKGMELASQFTKPSEFIAQLRAENMGQETVQGLTRMMPKEKAVEWAERSARMAGEQAAMSPEKVKALNAAKAWSANPTEEARAAAASAAANVPANSPAMWAANAAAFSKPMRLPEGTAPHPMADDLTAQMAAGLVQLSAAKLSPGGVPELPKVPEIPEVSEVPELPLDKPAVPTVPEVVMSQAKEMTPEQCAQATKMLDPFLDMGVKIAESGPGWS